MRIIALFLFTFLFSNFALAKDEKTLKADMQKLKQLQERVAKECINNNNSESYRVKVGKDVYTCPQLIVITDRLGQKLEKDVADYKELCIDKNQKSQHEKLAIEAANLAKKSVSCTPSPDAKNCLGKFTCGLFASTTPIQMILKAAGDAMNSDAMRQCSAQGQQVPACLLNILRGIFDSIWSSVSMIWDGAKWVANKTGEWLGIIKKSEAATSEKAMMAQQAGPSFLKQLATHPIDTMKTMAKNLFESLEEAAIDHYGCEKWSGVPFASTCVQKMTTWKCGSCQQKSQVYCGIAGYAVGEIGTAFLTGGLLQGGKSVLKGAVKLGTGPARNVAAFMGKTFPKSTALITKAATEVKLLAEVGLTVSQKKLVKGWEAVVNNPVSKTIGKASDRVAKSVVGKAATVALKPVSLYLNAMDNAFEAGGKVVEAGLKGSAKKVVTEEAVKGAKIADEAMEVSEEASVAHNLTKNDDVIVASSKPAKVEEVEEVNEKAGLVVSSNNGKVQVKAESHSSPSHSKSSGSASSSSSSKSKASKSEQSGGKASEADEVSDVVKYRTDPEYAELFRGKELYEGHHEELGMVIRAMEDIEPKMTKAQIRMKIQETLNSCQL